MPTDPRRASLLAKGAGLVAAGALVGGLSTAAVSGPDDAAELARLRAMESALWAEYREPGHITRDEVWDVLHVQAPQPTRTPTPTDVPTTTAPTLHLPDVTPTPVAGFPTEATTGIPEGTTLKPSGALTITKDGTVIDGLHIRGSVTVKADNVTIRRSLIDSTSLYPVQIGSEHSGLVIEDSEIDGNGKASVAILKGGYTLRRVEVREVRDGPRIEGDDVLIEASLIHRLTRVEGGHHDAIQIRKGRNIVIRGNSLIARRGDDPMNAAIQIGSALGTVPVSGLVVEGNYMDGGNYTINGGSSWVADAVYRGNTFGRGYRYGVKTNVGGGSRWEPSNRYEDGSRAG